MVVQAEEEAEEEVWEIKTFYQFQQQNRRVVVENICKKKGSFCILKCLYFTKGYNEEEAYRVGERLKVFCFTFDLQITSNFRCKNVQNWTTKVLNDLHTDQ